MAQAIYGGLYHIPGMCEWAPALAVLLRHVCSMLAALDVTPANLLPTLSSISSEFRCQLVNSIVAGVVVLGEGSLARQCFMNFVWLVGTYLFAAVLGVITGDIMERIQVHFTKSSI